MKKKIKEKYLANANNPSYVQKVCNEIISSAFDIDTYVDEFDKGASYLGFYITPENAQKIWEYEEKFIQYYRICALSYRYVAMMGDDARLCAAKFTKRRKDKFNLKEYQDDEQFKSLTLEELIENGKIVENILKIGEIREKKLKYLFTIIKRSFEEDYLSLKELENSRRILERCSIKEAAYHEAIGDDKYLQAEKAMINELYSPFASKVTSYFPYMLFSNYENEDFSEIPDILDECFLTIYPDDIDDPSI